MSDAEFAGSDTIGSSKVAEITGKSEEGFQPLIWQWAPPSGEIEAGIFALQAAIGGIMVGWVFGYWKGQKKERARSKRKPRIACMKNSWKILPRRMD